MVPTVSKANIVFIFKGLEVQEKCVFLRTLDPSKTSGCPIKMESWILFASLTGCNQHLGTWYERSQIRKKYAGFLPFSILFIVLKWGFESRGMSIISSLSGSLAQCSSRPAASTHLLLSVVVHLTASARPVTLYCGLP